MYGFRRRNISHSANLVPVGARSQARAEDVKTRSTTWKVRMHTRMCCGNLSDVETHRIAKTRSRSGARAQNVKNMFWHMARGTDRNGTPKGTVGWVGSGAMWVWSRSSPRLTCSPARFICKGSRGATCHVSCYTCRPRIRAVFVPAFRRVEWRLSGPDRASCSDARTEKAHYTTALYAGCLCNIRNLVMYFQNAQKRATNSCPTISKLWRITTPKMGGSSVVIFIALFLPHICVFSVTIWYPTWNLKK